MGWDMGQNVLDPGAKWAGPWGEMGWDLRLKALCPGAKWAGP